MADKCDMKDGPCACGAWHTTAPATKPKTLLQAAKDLRTAQKDYMLVREANCSPAIKEVCGQIVGARAAELDLAIERAEKQPKLVIVLEPSPAEQREMGVNL